MECGAQASLPDGARFCTTCGTAFPTGGEGGAVDDGTLVRQKSIATAESAFDRHDSDGNGVLSMDEAVSVAKGMGIARSEAFMRRAWSAYDVDGDGVLGKSEFSQLFAALLVAAEQPPLRPPRPPKKSPKIGAGDAVGRQQKQDVAAGREEGGQEAPLSEGTACHCAGWLEKKGGFRHNWLPRYFELHTRFVLNGKESPFRFAKQDEGARSYSCLRYFADQPAVGESSIPKGVIELDGGVVVRMSEAPNASPYEVELVTAARTYRIRANSTAQIERWIAVIGVAVLARPELVAMAKEMSVPQESVDRAAKAQDMRGCLVDLIIATL